MATGHWFADALLPIPKIAILGKDAIIIRVEWEFLTVRQAITGK